MSAAPAFPWLDDPRLKRVLAVLGAPGVDVRVVGGCVRDALAGRPIAEVDIATPEPPPAVTQRLQQAGIKVVPTGLAHGTVTAVLDGRAFEITTLRRDTACDGRHAMVAFSTDWREDAARRDFTINAMSLSPDGRLFDYFDGATDLAAGRVRFVGRPDDRIREDYLRILRLFRFHAHFGRTPLDAETLAACTAHRAGLALLSAERIGRELMKLLAAPDPAPSLGAMRDCGVLAAVLPEARDLAAVAALVALEVEFQLAPVVLRRLAALIDPARAGDVGARLRLSNHDTVRLAAMCELGGLLTADRPHAELDLLLYRRGGDMVRDAALLAAARRGDGARWHDVVGRILAWRYRPMPIGGDDLLALGLAPGPAIGAGLRAAEELWVRSSFAAGVEELLAHARAAAGQP